jgi:hypothetical protein
MSNGCTNYISPPLIDMTILVPIQMKGFTHHYFSWHEKWNGIDVMGCELKGVKLGGAGVWRQLVGEGLKHKLETWHV